MAGLAGPVGRRAVVLMTGEARAPAGEWLPAVPWWRRSMTAGALVIAAATTSWLAGKTPAWALGVLATVIAGIPLVVRAAHFGRATLSAALALLLGAVAGVYFALFVYLPVAALLLLAWLADPGIRPRTAPVTAAFGAAFFMLLAIVWTVEINRAF